VQSQPDRTDEHAAVLDVQLLDVFAQIEALLRSGREVQRELLRVRGVPTSTSREQRRAAVSRVQRLAMKMLTESRALPQIVRHLRGTANVLARHIGRTA
jgi:hypothetical protein